MKSGIFLLALLLQAAPASANPGAKLRTAPGEAAPSATDLPLQTTLPPGLEKKDEQPWFIRAMIVPQKRGMFIRLPVVDTDPNRGVTYGIMPIWVVKERDSDRIEQIHAPSVTFNEIFRFGPTYRYYYYPTPDATLNMRGAISKYEHEVLGQFDDYNFLGKDWNFSLLVQYNVDASHRFFGIGPGTDISAETNYVRDTLQYYVSFGVPLYPGSKWYTNVSHHLAGEKLGRGPIDTLPDIHDRYRYLVPDHRHQDSELRLSLEYDTRDNPITTTQGMLTQLFAETSQRPLGSEYSFQRYGFDLRYFYKTDPDSRYVTAGRLRAEQLTGTAPFWLMPQLGGKYIHRAYGTGRYIDRGMITSCIEERIIVFKVPMAGVSTEFEVAPFLGLGTVFPEPQSMYRKAARPVFGGAVRAIARPQVVGSIDFGKGQEGLSVFMDINYSF